jgi:hypothetical protein
MPKRSQERWTSNWLDTQGELDRYRWTLVLERLKVSNETVKAVGDGLGCSY